MPVAWRRRCRVGRCRAGWRSPAALVAVRRRSAGRLPGGLGAGGVAVAGLDDDVAELLGVGQPAQGVDRQLELLALGDRLLADLAGGDLQVLLADGGDHVVGASGSSAASLSGSSQARRL